MREFIRPVAITLSVLCVAASAAAPSTTSALAQAKGGQMAAGPAPAPAPAQQQVKQIALTDKQIDGVIAADKDIYPLQQKMPKDGKPADAKLMAQLEAASKKNGFASYADYEGVVDNISLVMGGIDPATKKFVGSAAVLKAQLAQVQADKKMSPKDKKAAIDDLNLAMKDPEPTIENKGNIDLVVKNYDKLSPILGDDKK
jgi:hypothetical protein